MITLASLWLPILVAAVVVFVASSIAWMLLPHHKPDWKVPPDAGKLLDVLRTLGMPPGQYMFPCMSYADLKDEERRRQWEAGPHGLLRLFAAKPNFARNLGLVFLFYVVAAAFTAYLARLALPAGAACGTVFRFTSTAAIGFFVLGGIPNALFMGRSGRSVLMDTIDGVAYGLLTAAVFGWLWPAA